MGTGAFGPPAGKHGRNGTGRAIGWRNGKGGSIWHMRRSGSILLSTACGGLEVQGEGLHIEKLSLDGGDLKVDGTVNALIYEPRGRERGGLLSRLLGG